ncbi:hypothetical protein BPORC_1812 [Bifidobacterium porcinum]|uniref:Uncharacterized protein n=1 Tax=Bifidobacterium thermacidophilum subsp. thermacidophilum TaxID=79262 RepID=A0A087E4M1_9BIFI|nr:hypothetical protein BPORC_1812 [Bifidobacterium porcinum]KFJ02722.1 hypothetical protein THER5_2003 [Bifidobacterium thermacidophilum subsp. thermacidophilum]
MFGEDKFDSVRICLSLHNPRPYAMRTVSACWHHTVSEFLGRRNQRSSAVYAYPPLFIADVTITTASISLANDASFPSAMPHSQPELSTMASMQCRAMSSRPTVLFSLRQSSITDTRVIVLN